MTLFVESYPHLVTREQGNGLGMPMAQLFMLMAWNVQRHSSLRQWRGTQRASLLSDTAAGKASGPSLNNLHWQTKNCGVSVWSFTPLGWDIEGRSWVVLLLTWPVDHPSSISAGGTGIEGPRCSFTRVAEGWREGHLWLWCSFWWLLIVDERRGCHWWATKGSPNNGQPAAKVEREMTMLWEWAAEVSLPSSNMQHIDEGDDDRPSTMQFIIINALTHKICKSCYHHFHLKHSLIFKLHVICNNKPERSGSTSILSSTAGGCHCLIGSKQQQVYHSFESTRSDFTQLFRWTHQQTKRFLYFLFWDLWVFGVSKLCGFNLKFVGPFWDFHKVISGGGETLLTN
jgi:hypothetical protein